MNRIGKTVSIVAFVALLSAGPAFTQTASQDATPETKAPAPAAYVYVQTHQGVNAYTTNEWLAQDPAANMLPLTGNRRRTLLPAALAFRASARFTFGSAHTKVHLPRTT